jgi:acyl carrier protein
MPGATVEQIKQLLKEHLSKQLAKAGISDPPDSLSLTESGLIDSFGLLEIVMAVQDKFGVTVDVGDADPDSFTTFGGFAETVAKYSQPA